MASNSSLVSFFFMWLSSVPNTIYWRSFSFFVVYFWLLSWKLVPHINVFLFLGCQPCPIGLCVYFSANTNHRIWLFYQLLLLNSYFLLVTPWSFLCFSGLSWLSLSFSGSSSFIYPYVLAFLGVPHFLWQISPTPDFSDIHMLMTPTVTLVPDLNLPWKPKLTISKMKFIFISKFVCLPLSPVLHVFSHSLDGPRQ